MLVAACPNRLAIAAAVTVCIGCSGGTAEPKRAEAPVTRDDCATFLEKSAPVLDEIATKAGRKLDDGTRQKVLDDCRSKSADKREALVDCVLAAAGTDAVRTCWIDAFAAYQKASDPTEALYDACKNGDGNACDEAGLAWMKITDGKQPHALDERIVDSWKRSCEIGTGMHGCGNLGSAYFFGLWSTPVDGKRGIEYWTKSCKEQGNKFICRKLEQAKAGQIQPGVIP